MYDLIIIGGGMCGIAVGYFFRNEDILLLEKADLLSGATGNNAGFLIAGFGEHFYRTASRWGIDRASEIQRIHLESHRMICELTNQVDRCGSFTVGTSKQETDELRISHQWMRSNGFHVEWIEQAPTAMHHKPPALFNPDDGLIQARQFWTELSNSFPKQTNVTVLKVIDEMSSLLVHTTQGEYRAKRVMYCLNAFSADLLPELAGRIIPLRGQMVELAISGDRCCEQPVIAEYGEIYWNFTEKTIRFGGFESSVPSDEVGIATSLSAEIRTKQLEWITNNLDVSFSLPPIKTWYGTMGFTVDGFPIVGPLPKRRNQYVLAGMCGLGHSYAMICSSWLHDFIKADKNVIPAYFSSDRIWNLPEYAGGDWRSLYEAWNH